MKAPPYNMFFKFSTLLLAAFALLAGCGQYGDLYLPPETTVQQAPEAQDNTEQQEETETSHPEDL